MHEKTMTIREAARQLGAVAERAHNHRESTLLVRNGEPVARIVPVPVRPKIGSELERVWTALPHLSPDEAEALEADLMAARNRLPPLDSKWE
jgi:antitoxin (DNA-binding transcriptional repressor) of toxin-antitoxin stability system